MPTKTALLILALAAPAVAETPGHLEPLGFLAGACWRGAFPDGKSQDEHCWEWAYGGRVLRDRHVVRGAGPDYAGETLYAWDPEKKAVVFYYFTNQGHVSSGTFEVTPEGIVFPERVRSAEGVREMKSVLTRGQDAYRMRTLERVGGEWKEMWSTELRRVRSAP
jgi:hypothetical protein